MPISITPLFFGVTAPDHAEGDGCHPMLQVQQGSTTGNGNFQAPSVLIFRGDAK